MNPDVNHREGIPTVAIRSLLIEVMGDAHSVGVQKWWSGSRGVNVVCEEVFHGRF